MAFFSFRDPSENLLTLQRELDQLLRRPLGFEWSLSSGVFPAVNVFNDKDGFVVRAEVPGIPPDALTVNVERQVLTIAGERNRDNGSKGSFHRRERRFGKFARSIQLPNDVDADKASAECRDGVLTVRIPKRAEAKPKQVTVLAA